MPSVGDLAGGGGDRLRLRGVEQAEARLVSAAASLISASARRKRRGMRWPEIGKLRTARWVDAP